MVRDAPPTGELIQWRLNAKTKPPAKPRTRTWAPKTRSGCRTCKKRKVKCDERRPDCQRCVRAGYQCEGYAPTKVWMFEATEHNSSSSSDEITGSPASVISSLSSWSNGLDGNEMRAMAHWTERTAPILSTFTLTASQFWQQTIIQASQSSDAIRSAMIAASSLHENVHYRLSDQGTSIPSKVYTKHYSQAISALTDPKRPVDPSTVLISCLIFLVCENLRNSDQAAVIHINSGLKVLREWKSASSSRRNSAAGSAQDIIFNQLEPIFARLEAQKVILPDAKRTAVADDFQKYDLNWTEPVIPAKYVDLFMARDAFNDIMQWFWYLTQRESGRIRSGTPGYLSMMGLLINWDRTLKSSFPLLENRAWPGWMPCAALRTHWHAVRLSVMSDGFNTSLIWDDHITEVEWMLDVSSTIIQHGPPAEDHESLWLYDFCLAPPLLMVGYRCRHPTFRRRAIELVRTQHNWNNDEPWDACSCAMVMSMVTDIEEAGLTNISKAADVPETNRIQPMLVSFATPGQIRLDYIRLPEPDPEHAAIESKTIKWANWTRQPLDEVDQWPFGEQVKHGNFQGLIRPPRRSCLCRTMGLTTDGTVSFEQHGKSVSNVNESHELTCRRRKSPFSALTYGSKWAKEGNPAKWREGPDDIAERTSFPYEEQARA